MLGLLVAPQKQLQLVLVLELDPQLGALKVVERLRPKQERKREPLGFEPALALEVPLLLGLLAALQKQLQLRLVLELEPQLGALKVVERLRPKQEQKLELLGVEPPLGLALELELVVLQKQGL